MNDAYDTPSVRAISIMSGRDVLSDLLVESSPLPRTLTLIEHLERHMVAHAGFDLYVRRRLDSQTGELMLTEARGLSSEALRHLERAGMPGFVEAWMCEEPAEVGQAVLIEHLDESDDAELDELRALGVQALCCIPLCVEGRLVGTLKFGLYRRRTFTEAQRRWLEVLMMLVATSAEGPACPGHALADKRAPGAAVPGAADGDFETGLGVRRGLADPIDQGGTKRAGEPAHYHSQLRHLVSELVLTEQRERRRIAGELHDHLAQLLVACKMKLALMPSSVTDRSPPPSPTAHDPAALLTEVDGFLDEALAYTRNLVAQISPVLLYEQGLLPALRWLAEVVMPRHGLNVRIEAAEGALNTAMEEDMRVLLFHSVRELLSNVVNHAGTTDATVSVHEHEHELEVVVSDEGAGFDVQQTGTPAADEAQQGFGLLSIRERMTLLGGRFELTTTPGAGTRASLRVPREATPSDDELPVEPALTSTVGLAEHGTAEGSGQIRVLVVDDHAVVREGLLMMVGKEEQFVIVGEAGDGPTALELTHRLRPHVVLMDVGLPGMDGIETTRQLTAAHKHVKVVGLSMHEDESTAAAMRAAGAVDYLCKGCSPELLTSTIRRAARIPLSAASTA